MPDEEMKAIRRQARSVKLTVGEYVRRTLRDVDSRRPTKSPAAKLGFIRQAVKHSFPTADIEQMNLEIERGYKA